MKFSKKRLFLDIETTFNEGVFFRAGFKLNIGYEQITKERVITCVCYKWEGQKKVYSLTWKNKSDKELLKKLVPIIEEAEEIIGHNLDKYDLAFIRARAVYHRIKITPYLKTIDTLKIARRLFAFNNNRLDYLGEFLGVGRKVHTGGFKLWKEVHYGCTKALAKMVYYCKGDVRLLEAVFKALYTYAPVKTSYAVKNNRKKSDCPECGGETIIHKHTVSAAGVKKVDLKCKSCGRMHRVAESAIK
jgi:DNA polymerase III epsilon subunit-like protein